MRTSIYVDGFNLYYGCLKRTSYKWLDIKTLFCNLLNPYHIINDIHYYTALTKPTQNDPSAPQRQQAYIRALEAYIPEFNIHYGHFLRHNVRMARAEPPHTTVEVIKTEEKGSDVNLSVNLLNDAWQDKFDCAVIVTNDSDMAEALRLIKEHHNHKKIGLFTPGNARTSKQLREHVDFTRTIRNSALANAQLPPTIPGTNITKPPRW